MRDKGRRIFIAGGGTGGHLYPGLAIAEAILRERPDTAIAFSTTGSAVDRKVMAGQPLARPSPMPRPAPQSPAASPESPVPSPQSPVPSPQSPVPSPESPVPSPQSPVPSPQSPSLTYPVTPIAARPFRRQPWKWPAFLVSLIRAGSQTRRRFREFCPDVVVGLGGYGSYPPVRVARKYGIPTVLLNPDIVPGKANRRLARRADLVCCQFEETVRDIGPSARLTGCPIRPSLLERTREEGLAAFGLDPARRTLLVTGGSSGAQTLNAAVVAMVREHGLPDGWQMLHLTGDLDYEKVAPAYRKLKIAAVVRAYEHQMALAYAAADLAIARAGASTLAELLAAGVPGVFLPYPFHRDEHQMRQARAVEREGAARAVRDRPDDPAATARDLYEAVRPLLVDEVQLAEMRRRAREVGRRDAARLVALAILELADGVADRRHSALLRDVDKVRPASYTPTGDTG